MMPHATVGASAVVLHQYILTLLQREYLIQHHLFLSKNDVVTDRSDVERYTDMMRDRPGYELKVHDLPCPIVGLLGSTIPLKLRAVALPLQIIDLIKKWAPELSFHFDIVSAALTVPLVSSRQAAWLGDLTFQTAFYHSYYAAREDWWRWPLILRGSLLSRAWKNLYRKTLRDVDVVIVSSHSSERELGKLGIRSRYIPYPWPDLSVNRKAVKPGLPTFLFLGNLVGLGSRSGFHFLMEPLYRELVKQWGVGGFRILVCGSRNLPLFASEQLRGKNEIQFIGFVENLGEWLSQCHAVIAPINVPVGNRTRIVTAMAFGTPVIAHKNTALGNPDLIHEENCLLASDAGTFARQMRHITVDDEFAQRLKINARATYERLFQPSSANAAFIRELEFTEG